MPRTYDWQGRVVKDWKDPPAWPGAALVAGGGMLAAGVVTGFISRDQVLSSWAMTALKGVFLSGAAVALGGVGRLAYDAVYPRWLAHQENRIELESQRVALERQRLESGIMVLPRDSDGRAGITFDGKVYRDHDTRASYTQELNLALAPVLEAQFAQLEAIRALARQIPPTTYHVENIRGDQVTPERAALEQEIEPGGPQWAQVYPMRDLLGAHTPSIHNLIVGVRPTEAGGLDVVTRSLNDLMHVLAVGASGWGKSTWLRSFLYQLARAQEPVEVCAIDTSGSALNALRGWGKLRYPVARTAADACAVLDQVSGEIENRRRMYEQHPHAENLREYNAASGQNMPPWVIVADESTHLLHHKGMGDPLRDVVQTARQYGVYLLMAGQSAHSKVIDSEIRDQFSSRLCFHTSPPSSRTVLDDSGAADLHEKGRAMVQLVGTELLELQGPWVSKEDFTRALSNGGPRHAMPVTLATAPEPANGNGSGAKWTPEQAQEVLRMHEAGESDTAIARALWHGTSYYIDRVRAILAGNNNNKTDENAQDPHVAGGELDPDRVVVVDVCEFCGSEVGDGETCTACGVWTCAACANDRGLCPDCQEG